MQNFLRDGLQEPFRRTGRPADSDPVSSLEPSRKDILRTPDMESPIIDALAEIVKHLPIGTFPPGDEDNRIVAASKFR